MNEIKIIKYINEQIFSLEKILKNLEKNITKENMTDEFWAMERNKLKTRCYIKAYKNIKRVINE